MAGAVVALSFDASVSPDQREALVEHAGAAFETRYPVPVTRHGNDRELHLLTTDTGWDARRDPLPLAVPSGTWRGVLLPPGAELRLRDQSAEISTDLAGLVHVYFTQGEGWCAASTSALVLGALRGGALDEEAWGSLALLGFLLGRETLFEGVERLPANTNLRVEAGRLQMSQRPRPDESQRVEGRQVLRAILQESLETHPDLGLELSGGLDSRVLLASIPPEERAGRTALTIGRADDADVLLARRIAKAFGLRHHVIEPFAGREFSPAEALERIVSSGRAREHAADALSASVLDDIESRAPQGARLTGVNGEFVRGFYYPGMGRSNAISRERVSRLARWRLFTNHRTQPWLFQQGWMAQQEQGVVDRTTRTLIDFGLPWREATDEYYLRERVPNWAGPGYSHASTGRPVVAPFLHPAFIDWARGVPVGQRSGSRALARTLVELEPRLARLPLADNAPPSVLARGGPRASADRARRFAGKVRHKVEQRVRNQRRPPQGAGMLVGPAVAALRELDLPAELDGVTFLQHRALSPHSIEAPSLDQPTVSYLANLLGVQRYLSAVEEARRSS